MSDDYDPNRPVWDKSQPGTLPEELTDAIAPSAKLATEQETMVEELQSLSPEKMLDRLDAIQSQANVMANSMGAALMTHEQDFIYGWQRQKTVAEESLKAFENPDYAVEEREYKIETCKRNLATALYKLGQIDAALSVAYSIPDSELVGHIYNIQWALDAPDSDIKTHSCPRPVARLEHQGKDVQIELDRRWASEEVFSLRHGQLAHVWKCTQCGFANASPDIPERQQRYVESHTKTLMAVKDGKALPDSVLLPK